MHSFEVITPEANCPRSRLQPKRHGAALIQKVSVFFVGDPDVVVAKVNRFSFVGRSFKQSVHIFAPGLKSSRNYKAIVASKLNQARLDGEPHNPSGLVFAVGVVNARDELTKRQGLLLVIDLHGMNIGQETARALWGVYLIWDFRESDVLCARLGRRLRAEPGAREKTPIRRTALNDGQLDAEQWSGIIIAVNHRLMAGFASLAATRSVRGHCRVHARPLVPFATTDPARRVLAARRKGRTTDSGLTPAASLFPRPG